MITLPLEQRLEILADSAKYDVSCSSSGSNRAGKAGALGNSAASGICHTWSADGRCISLPRGGRGDVTIYRYDGSLKVYTAPLSTVWKCGRCCRSCGGWRGP